MTEVNLFYLIAAGAVLVLMPSLKRRIELSLAKHPSLTGHARMARRIASFVRFYEYGESRYFRTDGAPDEVASARRAGFMRLSSALRAPASATLEATRDAYQDVSDLQFTANHRVPFQFRHLVRLHLPIGAFVARSEGTKVVDLDGNALYDLSGSYGLNVFGYDYYKSCIDAGVQRVRELGPVLGPYHRVVGDNARRLREISGLEEVSFHMSGTEAIMQAVRLARYHTGRTHLVRFCGAYHGWWGDVQPGVGNPAVARETYTLKDMDPASLRVLRTRSDIACVLVNPLQALHPNDGAPGDSTLIDGRRARFDREAYTRWLRELRAVCTQRGIVLIFDEVFVGFRIARGGAQEYFGVRADLVTYGKTLGGGLPVGVLCGRRGYMKRYSDTRPADMCFARGTFNSHPYVMGAMNEFLRRLETPDMAKLYEGLDEKWNSRAATLNERFRNAGVPVEVANFSSIWTIGYTRPGRYHWMLQYYFRVQGLALSWVGTGRLIFSLNCDDEQFAAVADRMVAAAVAMEADGWWRTPSELTSRHIRRQVLKEILVQLVRPSSQHAGTGQTQPEPALPREETHRV